MNDIQQLNARWGIAEKIEFYELSPGFPAVRICNDVCEMRVSLYGGHLLYWRPYTQKESVIYENPKMIFKEGKALRGGVPICWPWFGANSSDKALPSHGFARIHLWEIDDVRFAPDLCTLTLVLPISEAMHDMYPYDAKVKLTLRAGNALTMALTTQNTGTEPFTFSNALHSYLRVGDATQAVIENIDALSYLDATDALHKKIQCGALRIDREIDRVYLETLNEFRLHDTVENRTVVVRQSGTRTAVIWNPWIEKSAAFADFPDDGYQHMVCIEAVNAFLDEVTLFGNTEHSLIEEIHVI